MWASRRWRGQRHSHTNLNWTWEYPLTMELEALLQLHQLLLSPIPISQSSNGTTLLSSAPPPGRDDHPPNLPTPTTFSLQHYWITPTTLPKPHFSHHLLLLPPPCHPSGDHNTISALPSSIWLVNYFSQSFNFYHLFRDYIISWTKGCQQFWWDIVSVGWGSCV